MAYDDLSICVPAYNEADVIGTTLAGLHEHFPGAEILFVDDGSTDGTLEIAKGIEGITVLSHGRNIGYGAAIKTALRNASRKAVVWVDGDGQHRPEDLAKVVGPVLAGQADAVIGVRARGSAYRVDRLPGKWVLRILAQFVVRESIPDLNSGLRCFRRDVIMRYLHLLPDGFSASTTSTLLMLKRGYRVAYQDILTQPRVGSSSVRILRDGWRTIHLIVRILVLFEAFGFFTFLSLAQIIPALIYGVVLALVTRRGVPVLAAVVAISGLLTFFMGLICDQIVALRKERFEEEAYSLSARRR